MRFEENVDCALKSILAGSERTSCVTTLHVEDPEEVERIEIALASTRGEARDLRAYAQSPIVDRSVLTSTKGRAARLSMRLLNPGPQDYRSRRDTITGSLNAHVVYLQDNEIVGIDAQPESAVIGHLPAGEGLRAVSQIQLDGDHSPDDYAVFFAMRPLPEDSQAVRWEVLSLDWDLTGSPGSRGMSIDVNIENRSSIASLPWISLYMMDADGSILLGSAVPFSTEVPAGWDFTRLYSIRRLPSVDLEAVADLEIYVSSFDLEPVPEPIPSPSDPVTATPSPQPTEPPSATPTPSFTANFRISLPLLKLER